MRDSSVRLLICAGGTGGGVYPALTVLQALISNIEAISGQKVDLDHLSDQDGLFVLWIGGIGGMEADLVKRNHIPFQAIPAAGVHGVGWRAMPGNILRLGKGYFASRKIIKKYKPDVLLFTGGYVAVPMALAGRYGFRKRIPSVLYVPDIEPGLALRTLARFADGIAVTTPESLEHFPAQKRLLVSGYPVRPELAGWNRQKAQAAFDLDPNLPALLVMGGSSGAQSINNALLAALPELLPEIQIIHLTGQRNWQEVEMCSKSLPESIGKYYHPYPYLHEEMGAALSAADLVVSRGGASALGEYPQFGLPAILVPYPHAWQYQYTNANYLAQRNAAVILTDDRLKSDLVEIVRNLLCNPEKLASMRTAMRSLARPEAAEAISGLLLSLASRDRSDK